MTVSTNPDIAADLTRIHLVVTRGVAVAREHCQTYARDGFPDAATQEGFIRYVEALVTVLDGHHLTEDEMVFPYLQTKLPDAPYAALMAEHQVVVQLLNQVSGILTAIRSAGDPRPALADLEPVLARLDAVWHPHRQKEETHFTTESLAPLIPPDEQARVGLEWAKHGQEHAGPPPLAVPFILYNLTPDERAIMLHKMPPVVTQELVPGPWKEQWGPMKPFLLD
jgi:hemerythrin-like domain-containing protein